MNCDRVKLLLHGYVDGELDLLTSLEIEEHLWGCASCLGEHRLLVELHTATRDKSLYHPAPARLEKQIRASLRKANPARPPWPVLSWRWLASAAVLAVALLVIGTALSGGISITSQETRLAQEVQAAHVRSLMPNHLADVVSSDQHTVKPWFNGKLDFSPPVTDLAAQGFPLLGGRLDYLDGQPVAALVYQRNKHYINVFIWPSADQRQGLQSTTDNGYHLVHWYQSGMTYWAASDLNSDELLTFIDLFQKSTGIAQ